MKISEIEGAILEFSDLLAVELRGDNLTAHLNDWEGVLAVIDKRPTDEVLESLFLKQLRKVNKWKTLWPYIIKTSLTKVNKEATQIVFNGKSTFGI